MDRMIFINLPVTDLSRTRRFYRSLGFQIDETFSDEHCTCVVISPTIVVMALDHSRFADFIATPIADATQTTQVLNCLSMTSREEVDRLVAAAMANGGAEHLPAAQLQEMTAPDGSTMYGRSITDPDGHVWELLHSGPPAA